MLIFRYLAKEVFITLVGLTGILMLIFMSNQFIQYLNRAVSGDIPGVIILKLMMLELPNLMGLLLPLGFYVAILLAYGRMYADNEMTVLKACGYGQNQLLKHTFIIASLVAILVAILMLFASPYIAVERAKLIRSSGVQTLIKTIMPGKFQSVPGGKQVFYVEAMNSEHNQAKNIFFAKQTQKDDQISWDILWADQAFAETDPQTFEDYVVLKDGKEYQGIPGQTNYQVSEFSEYKARLPHPVIALDEDIRTYTTGSLWPLNNPNRVKATELQWRLSVPLMVLTLTLVAVPLSRVNPRSGKFAKLLPAILVYIIYANLLFFARNAMMKGTIPLWLGMWWLHLLVIALGLFLIWRGQVKLS